VFTFSRHSRPFALWSSLTSITTAFGWLTKHHIFTVHISPGCARERYCRCVCHRDWRPRVYRIWSGRSWSGGEGQNTVGGSDYRQGEENKTPVAIKSNGRQPRRAQYTLYTYTVIILLMKCIHVLNCCTHNSVHCNRPLTRLTTTVYDTEFGGDMLFIIIIIIIIIIIVVVVFIVIRRREFAITRVQKTRSADGTKAQREIKI